MNNLASYKKPAILETDKKVNLIYGLNGTGKSTFSDYLYNMCLITDFKEALGLVFTASGYEEHYEAIMKRIKKPEEKEYRNK